VDRWGARSGHTPLLPPQALTTCPDHTRSSLSVLTHFSRKDLPWVVNKAPLRVKFGDKRDAPTFWLHASSKCGLLHKPLTEIAVSLFAAKERRPFLHSRLRFLTLKMLSRLPFAFPWRRPHGLNLPMRSDVPPGKEPLHRIWPA